MPNRRKEAEPRPVRGESAGQNHVQQFPVVAVGASAGGLEALTDLLHSLPADTGMAFVFIQHLTPGHESILSQLLSRETSMPVNQIEDGTVLAPNQVHVIPPDAALTISGDRLALSPRGITGTAIDVFLRSLAVNRKNAAVAVILSGTGSDGALGVQAITEGGGVVIAQDPASAKFDGMPRSAIATGCVDLVLPPNRIAAELARIAREPRLVQPDILEASRQFPKSQKDSQALFELLQAGTGIDFSLYRQTTVRRRLLRRLALLKIGSLADYEKFVKENPEEGQALVQDVLIRVTRFFRDPEAFEVLSRRVFPALIRRAPSGGAVRVWVPGCSTGEEAYSIAISFLEVAEQLQSRVPLQLFATDINEAAVEKARRGAYIQNIAADVPPGRLARFFVRTGREFQVCRRLRDLCIFSRHDLLNDPPFSRMDLVSCRNVLIYLDSMQDQAFSRFHFALNPGGFLLLGKSETAGSSAGLFTPLDKVAKLYVKQDSARPPVPRQGTIRKKGTVAKSPEQAEQQWVPPERRIDLHRQADRVIVERYGPPWVIVDDNLETVAQSGETAAFPAPTPGLQNRKILEVIEKGEADALKDAIRTAGRTGQSIRIERVKLGEGASLREFCVELTPLGTDRRHFLLVFEDLAGRPEPDLEPAPPGNRRKHEVRLNRLEKELASSRAHLESVIIEQEAASEEIVASNEELQSLNEELESSQEELEATNEELTTVNQELQVRNTELETAREFAQATIETVRGSLVVLGHDLRVLKANEHFYRTFRVTPVEIEHRFIYELGEGRWSNPRLRELIEEVLPKNRSMTDFEMEQEVPPAGRRVLLLNARRFEGDERILLSIEDVTERKRVEEESRQSHKLEAVGYLAAGVAHDFNNLLTSVIGNASLLLDALPEDDPGTSLVMSIINGGERAAELTRQLLAYAGKSRFYLERVDLSEVVIQTASLLHPSIPAKVQLRLDLDKHLPLLLADPSQMQQVVMNLMINGIDAIDDRDGIVQVRSGRQDVTDEPLRDCVLGQGVSPGSYVFLEVVDNGSGMDNQTIQRIFDPFFTTKFTGRGLGLAAVSGIVQQHKGAIQVHSVPGRGSSFTVLFPATEKVPARIAEGVGRADLAGAGTILVVDDEELIRNFTRSALQPYGYDVLLARDGQEAVRLFQERSGEIRLVLLDFAMPGMDGLETLNRIREISPDVPVVVCSGFGDVDIEARFAGKKIAGFFQKPYTVKQLAGKVKACLQPDGSGTKP